MGIMRRNSLRDKLILFLLASIILPISTSILITYAYTKESVKQYHIRETTNLIHQGAMNIMNYMNQANEASLLVYNNLSEANSLYQLIQDGSQTYLEDREMYRNLQFIANSVKEIEQVYLYSSVEDISYRFAYNLMRSSPGQTYEAPAFGNEAVWTEAVHMSHEYGVGKPRFSYHIEQEVFTIHRAILEAPSDHILGHLAIDIRTDKIREISEALYTPGEQLYIFDDHGRLIYAPHSSSLLDEDSRGWMKEILERIVGVGEVDVLVTIESTEEIVVEKNVQQRHQVTDEKDRDGGTRHINDVSKNGEIVLYQAERGQSPLVLKRIKPEIRGVLVVAAGSEDATVKRLIVQAVERGLGVPPHRVAVVPRKR